MVGFNLAQKVDALIRRNGRETMFRATVTGTSGNLVTVRRTGQLIPDVQSYAKLASYSSPVADDEVIVLRIGGGYIVLGKVTR